MFVNPETLEKALWRGNTLLVFGHTQTARPQMYVEVGENDLVFERPRTARPRIFGTPGGK